MKILIVANGFPPSAYGGVEVYCYDLARELLERGHTVKVFCRESNFTKADGEYWEDSLDGIPVVRIVNDMKTQQSTFRQGYIDEAVEQAFERLLEDFCPDVVHINHLIALSARLPMITRQRGIPTVMTLHDYWTVCQRVNLLTYHQKICSGQKTPEECYQCAFVLRYREDFLMRVVHILRSFIRKGLEKLYPERIKRARLLKLLLYTSPADFAERQKVFNAALEQVDQVVVPSAFIQSVIAANGYKKERIKVVPLGIGFPLMPERETIRQGPLRFGFVGTILPTKGLKVLIRAFRSVAGESIRLDIYGRDDILPAYSKQMRALAEGDPRITFHGSFSPDQRAAIFEQMDVFVMPSIWHETFSFVAREALQARVPVIASRVGALQEAVTDGVNGFLFPPGDHQALSQIIHRIAENPQQLSALTVPGPIQILQVPEHVDRIEHVYQQICEEHDR